MAQRKRQLGRPMSSEPELYERLKSQLLGPEAQKVGFWKDGWIVGYNDLLAGLRDEEFIDSIINQFPLESEPLALEVIDKIARELIPKPDELSVIVEAAVLRRFNSIEDNNIEET